MRWGESGRIPSGTALIPERQVRGQASRAYWSAVALVLATVIACESIQGVVPLPTHPFGPSIDSVAYEGTLAFENPCLFLTAAGRSVNVLWPAGYRRVGHPPAVVRDDGEVIARAGDAVVIGGAPADVVGGASAGGPIAPPGCPRRDGLLVGLILTVNGVEVPPPRTPQPLPTGQTMERPRPR